MHEGVNAHARVILICSKASLTRSGVRNEINETLAREARDNVPYLIPVAIDGYIFVWDDPVAVRIRDRVVADFRFMDTDTQISSSSGSQASDIMATPLQNPFHEGIQSLLRALRRKKRNA